MNKIYKVIYNKNKHRYEVVSELAKSHGGKCKTTVATAGDTNWLRRLWMRVRGGVNKRDEDGNPVTMSISRAAMVALMCISVWSAAAVSSSWVEAASVEGEPVSVKYDEATGTIKIIKTDPNTSDETILATYAVGGKISPITSIGTKNPTGIIAIGDQSKAVQSNTIAIGADAHAGDVGGSDDTNGRIAIGTKTVASGLRSIALGNYSTTNKGSYNIVQGSDSIGIGTSTSIFGYSGVSIGRRNIIGIPDPDLVKDGVLTTKSRTKYSEGGLGGNSVIVGAYNVAYGNRSNVIGTYSRAMGSNSVAIGSGVQSLSDGAIAIGKGSGYEFEDGSRHKRRGETEDYGRDWELPPEYKVLKQVLSNDIAGDEQYKGTGKGVRYENGGILPKYNNYGAGSSDPGGFIVEGKNALGIGTYTQVLGDSAIGLATGEMTADLSDKDKSAYARDMKKIMDMEETLYDAKEALTAGATTNDPAALQQAVKTAEESLAAAKKAFRETYLTKYSFVDGDGALGVGRQILAQGDRSMAVGDYAKAISNDAIAYGGQTLANGTNSMAMGGSAHVGTEKDAFANSMAIGSHTNVQAGNAVALGAFSQVTGENSLALGFGKQTDSAITYNSVSGKDSTLIGSYGTIQGNNSILIGSNGNIANDRVVGLGNNINIEAADQNDQENNTAGSVLLGDHAGYVKDSKRSRSLGQVDVVGSAGKMELTESLSSTKGALRDYTKDFIYIYMLERQDDGPQIGAPIAVRSDFAGGDSTVGVVSVGSTYEQKFDSLKDIKDYHTKVGSLITVPVDVTVQVTKNGVLLGEQKQIRYFAADSTYDEIYADNTLKDEDKAKVWKEIQTKTSTPNTTYTVFETRRIQNVAPGLIGLNSTDAINGSQLFATNQMLGNLVGSLKKTLGDNVTVTEDGQIAINGDIQTLGWIAKADTVDGSNGKVAYDVDKETDETEEAYQARIAKLEEDGYIVDASKVMTFKAGKNIGLVQKPGEFSISTIDTPSFKSVELRGDETKDVDGNKVTPVTMLDSNGMQVYTETVTPGDAGPTTTKKVSTTVNNEGVTTDGTVKVTNGKDGGDANDLVTIGKEVNSDAAPGTDGENGTIGLNGKNGSEAVITIDRGTKSLDDSKNLGVDPTQPIGESNAAKSMDRITYVTKGADGSTINHEVATLDDGFFLTTSKDVKDKNAPAGVKLNHTIKFTDGANTKVSTVTSDNNGVHSLHIDVNGLPVVYTDKDGNKLTKVGDKFYKDDQFDNGTLKSNATPSNAKNISIVNPDGSISKTDRSAPTTVNNVGSSIGGEVNNGAPTGSTINGEPGNNSFIDKLNTVGGTGNDAISKNAVVTTGDLKNLADTPLFFSGDAADGKEYNGATNTKNTFGRKLSEEAKIVGGVTTPANLTDNNIGVVSNGSDTLTVKLAKNLKDLDSTTYTSDTTDGGDAKSSMKVDGNGVRFVDANGGTVDNTPTFTTNGITGGNKTITDVASGIGGEVEDAAHDNANTFLENVNKIGKKDGDRPAADAISEKVVVNAKDLKNLVDTGFKLNTSGQPTDSGATTVKIGETINIVNGANTKVSAITTSKDGVHAFHIDVTGMPISYTDGEGNALTKIGDNYYKNTDIEDGKPKDNAVAVPADKVTNNVKVVNKDGGTTEQGSIGNVKSVFDSTIGNGGDTGSQIDGINDANKVEKVPGTNQFIKDLTTLKGDTPADKEKLNSVSTVGDLQKVALTPLFFEGDTADGKTGTDGKPHKNTFGRKLSETAKIIGGQTDVTKLTDGNIGVVSNGSDTLTIKLAKELTDLTSVTAGSGDNTTTMTAGGATTTSKVDDIVKTISTTPNGMTTTEQKVDTTGTPTGESKTTMVTPDGVTVTTGTTDGQTTKTALDKDGLATDGKVVVTNGKDGDAGKKLVTIDKVVDANAPAGTDGEHGQIGLDGKNGSEATITIDRGTKSLADGKNIAIDPTKPVGENNPMSMDRITYTTKGANGSTVNHEVATLDDGLFFSGDSADGKSGNTKNTFGRKLTEEMSIVGGVDLGLQDSATADQRMKAIADKLTDGNIGVISDGTDTLTVKLAKQLKGLDSATYTSPTTKSDDGEATSTMKVDGNGIRFVGDNNAVKTDAPSLTTDGIDGGNKQITNVGSGFKNGDKTISMSDLDDSEKWPNTNPIWNNAVNVGDLKKAKDAATTEVTGTGKAIVTKTVGNKGQNIYNVHVDPVVDVVATDGKTPVVRGDDGKYYNPKDIADKTFVSDGKGGGSWYNKSDIGPNGKPNTDAPVQKISPVDVKNNFVNPNGTGSIVLDNVKSGIGGEVQDPSKNKANTFLENVNKVGATTDGISENTVVNAKDLKNVVDTGFKLNTSGQGTNPADTVKIGDTIQVVDGKNTTVSAITHPSTGVHEFHIDVTGLPVTYTATETDGEGKPTGTPVDVTKTKDGYQKADGTPLIKINENGKDVYYTTDQLDNNVPKPGAKGLTITDNIRLINPKDGIGATKITNVAAGTDDTDAVNVSQLKEMAAGASTEVTGTGKAIVTSKKGDAGQTVYNVHVDPVVEVQSKDGSEVTRGGDGKYYKSRDIADKVYVPNADGNGGNWYNKTDVTDGKPNTGANPQTPVALKQSDIKTSLVNPNAGVDSTSMDNSIILDNVKSGIGGDAGNNGIPKDSTIDGTTGDNSFIKNLDTVGKAGGIDKNTVVNAGDLKNLADTPLFFTGDSADGVPATDGTDKNTFGRKLSEEMKIVGGVDLGVDASASAADRAKAIAAKLTDGNIGVISDGTDTLTVKLAKELKDLDSVKVSNGKDGKDGKNLVTIGKEVDDKVPAGKDGENGIIGLDGKNGSEAVITIDRGTKSITDEANIGEDPSQPVSDTNKSANMDRITYTTKGANGDINHEVATLDDGFMLTTSTDVSNSKAPANVKLNNTIKFTDGANTKVSKVTTDSTGAIHELHIDVNGLPTTYVDGDGKPITKVGDSYVDADGETLVKVGDAYYRKSQLNNPDDPAAGVKPGEQDKGVTFDVKLVSPDGITNTPKLNNVGSSLVKGDGTRITMGDLNDSATYPATNPIWNSAVNVGDLKAASDAAKTEVTGTGAAEVTKKTAKDGHDIYNVHVDKLMEAKSTEPGKTIVRGSDNKYYYVDNALKQANDGKWYPADQVGTDGKPADGAVGKDTTELTVVLEDKLKNSLVNPNGNGPTVLDNVKSGIGGAVKDADKQDANTFLENVNKIGKKDGDQPAADAISENIVVNAKDLKNLVDTGFKLNTSGHTGEAQTVKIGDTIKVVDGANTRVSDITPADDGTHTFHIDVTGLPMTYTVSQTSGTDAPVSVSKVGDTYQLADGTKLVKVGDKFYKPSQLVDPKADQPQVRPEEVDKNWTVNDSISLVNKEGSDKSPTLKNVGSGLKDAAGNATSIDQAVGTNAVNVDDLRTMGKAATTEVTGSGKAIVTKKTASDGHNIYNVHVDPIVDVVGADGSQVVRGDDGKYYKPSDIENKTYIPNADGNGGNWYDNGDLTDGAPKPGAQPQNVTPTDVKNNFVNPNGTGSIVLDNVKSGIGGKVDDPDSNHENTFMKNVNTIGDTNGISENTVVNAGDLKNLVDTGFKLNTSGHSGDAQTVKIGETIKVVDGANTKVSDITSKDGVHEFHIDVTGLPMTYTVSQKGDAGTSESVSKVGDTYQLADGTKLVKVGDKFYKPSQLVDPKAEQLEVKPEEVNKDWTVNDSISLVNKEGSDKSPTLKNVGSGLKDAAGNATSIDQAVGTNAVNVDDLRTMGKAATTEVTGSGAAEVTKVTGEDGQNIYNVHVDKLMTVKPVDANTNIARGGDGKYYNADDIAGKTFVPSENKWYNTADVDENTGKPLKGKTPLDEQPTAVDQNTLKNSLVNPNGNGPTVLDNVKSGIGGEVKDAAGNNTFIDNINKVVKKSDDGTVAPGAISEDTVVNAGDLKNLVDTGFKLNTSGHSGDAQTVKIGDTIKVVDGANTRVSDITSKDGVHTFHIDVTGLPVTYTATKTDANGTPTGEPVDVSKVGDGYQLADGTKLEKAGDKYYTPDQLENGQPKPDEEGLTIKESVSLTQDNSAPATLERVGSGRRNGMKANAAPMAWDKILNPSTADDKAKVDNMLTNAANIGDVRDAIKSITDGTSDNASGGFGLTGNNGDVKQDLGKTITVKGGIANKVDEAGQDLHVPEKSTTDQNTYVNVKDVPNADGNGTHKEMVVEIAKDLTDLDSVTVGSVDENGNGGTVINKDGMTVKDATGNNSTSIGTGTIGTSKTDKDGNTSSTNIDGGTITSEKKDKDGNKQSTTIDGSHITLENKDKDGKLTGPKTEVSNEGMTITPVDKDGNAVTDPKKQVSITDKGLNNGGNQIINVDSGLKDTNGSVKLKDATGDMLNNAVNVGDLKEAINNAQTAVDGDGAAEISKSVDDNGRPTYKVHVDKLVEAKADDGKAIVRGEDNKFYYKDESLQQGTDGKWYAPDQLNPDNTPVEGAVGKATTELTVVPQDKLKTSLVNPNGDGATKLDNIKSAIGGEVKDANGNNTFIDNLNNVGKIGADGKPIIGEDAAVTTGDLKNLADTPLYFSGDRAENATGQNKFDRKLSEETKIVGGAKGELSDNNIGVVSNGRDTLTVKLSKDLKDLNTIEVNDSVSVGKDGDSTVIKGSETTSSFTEVATGPDGQPLYEVDEKGEVVRDANGDPIPVTKTSSTTTKGGTVTIKDSNVATGPDRKPLYKVDEKGNPVLDEKGHKIPITESSSTTTGGGKLATDVEKVKMVDGKPVTSHETTTIDGSHFESKDKDGNYTTINGGEIKSYDKDTNGSVTIKGDSLTASSKDENGHDKVTNISSDGFNSTATTFERDGNGQLVLDPDTGLPKEVTNKTNINSDGFTATRTDSEGNEVLKTTMQNGNIAIEKPQPIIDPTTGEAYKVLDKNGNWVPAHGYTKISDNGFEIQGINQSGTGISKVRLSSEGLDNGGNRITHVAEGVAPDDAVNVSQLRGLTQNINNDIANVGANAAALAGLKAIQYDPLEPTQIMAAVGTYRGKQAAALGIAHYKNEDTMFHMGVSIGSDHTMANIGVTYKFGRTDEKKAVPDRYKAGPISSTYVLQDEMVALKEENARMRANDEKMNAAYDEILDLVKQLKQDNEEMKKKLEKLEKK